MVYFDNAATSFPKPRVVQAAMAEALRLYGANPGRSGHKLSVGTAEQIFNCRADIAKMFGAKSPANVVFTQNCTHALNLAIKGVMRQGDHAIISDLEHNSILRPMHALKKAGVIDYDVLKTSEDEAETIERLRGLIREKTRLVAVTHGSNVFGVLSPVEAMARVAHEHGALFLLDAAQSAGVVSIDVQKMGIDFLCMPGHKGLYGPTGTGVLIAERADMLTTIVEGGTGSNSLQSDQPDFMPDMLESGTVNVPGIMGLHAGVKFIKQKGVAALYEHEMALTAMLYDGLEKLASQGKAVLYTPRPRAGAGLPVLAFNLAGMSSERCCELFDAQGFCLRGGYHCAPLAHTKMGTLETGVARASLGAFNTKQQVRAFLRAASKIASK